MPSRVKFAASRASSAATRKSATSADWLNHALRALFELDSPERFAAQVVPQVQAVA
jgi:hypothetical protein